MSINDNTIRIARDGACGAFGRGRDAGVLRARGVDVTVTIGPNLRHDILLEPITFEQLSLLVRALSSKIKRPNHEDPGEEEDP